MTSTATEINNILATSSTLRQPYVVIAVLVAGTIGGLLLVISAVLFCKYCVQRRQKQLITNHEQQVEPGSGKIVSSYQNGTCVVNGGVECAPGQPIPSYGSIVTVREHNGGVKYEHQLHRTSQEASHAASYAYSDEIFDDLHSGETVKSNHRLSGDGTMTGSNDRMRRGSNFAVFSACAVERELSFNDIHKSKTSLASMRSGRVLETHNSLQVPEPVYRERSHSFPKQGVLPPERKWSNRSVITDHNRSPDHECCSGSSNHGSVHTSFSVATEPTFPGYGSPFRRILPIAPGSSHSLEMVKHKGSPVQSPLVRSPVHSPHRNSPCHTPRRQTSQASPCHSPLHSPSPSRSPTGTIRYQPNTNSPSPTRSPSRRSSMIIADRIGPNEPKLDNFQLHRQLMEQRYHGSLENDRDIIVRNLRKANSNSSERGVVCARFQQQNCAAATAENNCCAAAVRRMRSNQAAPDSLLQKQCSSGAVTVIDASVDFECDPAHSFQPIILPSRTHTMSGPAFPRRPPRSPKRQAKSFDADAGLKPNANSRQGKSLDNAMCIANNVNATAAAQLTAAQDAMHRMGLFKNDDTIQQQLREDSEESDRPVPEEEIPPGEELNTECRNIWALRSTLEILSETEDDHVDGHRPLPTRDQSTTILVENQSDYDLSFTSCNTSFESASVPPSMSPPTNHSGMLLPPAALELKRQKYRNLFVHRQEQFQKSFDSSFESIDGGNVESDSSRQEAGPDFLLTSIESSASNCSNATSDSSGRKKILQLNKLDSGYKSQQSSETQQHINSNNINGNNRNNMNLLLAAPSCSGGDQGGAEDPLSPGDCRSRLISMVSTISTISSNMSSRPETRLSGLDLTTTDVDTDSMNSDRQESGESGIEESPIGRTQQVIRRTSFGRRSGMLPRHSGLYKAYRRAVLQRDYSIDSKTDSVFREFLRYDPALDKRVPAGQRERDKQQQMYTCRRNTYSAGSEITRPLRYFNREDIIKKRAAGLKVEGRIEEEALMH